MADTNLASMVTLVVGDPSVLKIRRLDPFFFRFSRTYRSVFTDYTNLQISSRILQISKIREMRNTGHSNASASTRPLCTCCVYKSPMPIRTRFDVVWAYANTFTVCTFLLHIHKFTAHQHEFVIAHICEELVAIWQTGAICRSCNSSQ